MNTTTDKPAKRSLLSADGIAAPLRHAVFRRIWLASLLTNLGLMINGVGAAWAMTQMTSSASMVALVQTALMLPIMLLSLAAGAIADMYDRRIVGLTALSLGLLGGVTLAVLAYLNAITPNSLLLFCFLIGSSMALFGPAWQASVSEQVPAETLPSAVALNGISYNIARSFGPALGGIIVAAAGRGGGVRLQCAALYSAHRRALSLAAHAGSRRGCRRSGSAAPSSPAFATSFTHHRSVSCSTAHW